MLEVQSSMMISSIRPARKGRWRPHFPAKISGKSAAQSGCKQAVALETPSTSHSREKKSLRPWGCFLPSLSIPGKKTFHRWRIERSSHNSNQILRVPSPVEQWRPSAAVKGEKNKWRTRGEKTHLAQCRGGEGEVKKNQGRSRGAWVAGAVSQPANSGAISQHPVFRAAASWMMADAAFSLVVLFYWVPPSLHSVWLFSALRQPMVN